MNDRDTALKTAQAALEAMLNDYRSEGCPDPECGVCKRSKAAEQTARNALDLLRQR